MLMLDVKKIEIKKLPYINKDCSKYPYCRSLDLQHPSVCPKDPTECDVYKRIRSAWTYDWEGSIDPGPVLSMSDLKQEDDWPSNQERYL
jgi:hypothetical protein